MARCHVPARVAHGARVDIRVPPLQSIQH